MTIILYGMPDRSESLKYFVKNLLLLLVSQTYSKVPIQARLNKKRHGNIGSGRHSSLVTIRSLTKKRNQSTADTTNSEIAVPDFQANWFEASKRTVTRSRVAPKSKKAPDRSSLDKDRRDIFCRRVGATYDNWP